MNTDVLKSYLVSLGFQVNQPQLAQFKQTLEDVGREVESHAEGVGRVFIGMGTTIAAAYAAIGAATVGLMDHVAQGELGFQLYAMRMYMTTDAGKKLKISLDALGHSLEEVAWNPELQARYHQLVEDQVKLQAGLGPEYLARMKALRDVRFEFTRMRVEVQYLAMGVVNALAKAFGTDTEGVLHKLRQFNEWMITHLPEISDKIATHLVPVLRDAWAVMKDLYEVGRSVAGLFIELWKAIGGDPDNRISKQNSDLENFAIVLEEISHAIRSVTDGVVKFKDAIGIGVGVGGGARLGALLGSLFGPVGTLIGTLVGGAAGGAGAYYLENRAKQDAGTQPAGEAATSAADHARELAKRVSMQTGVPADWIFAQWAHETGFFKSRAFREQNNLAGMREGANYRTFSTMDESANYFANLLMSPRYRSAREANSLEGYAYGLKRGGYYEDTYANYSNGLARWAPSYAGGGDVHVGGVQVYVTQPGATAEEIHSATVRAIDDRLGRHAQRQIAQFSGPYR